MRDREAPTVVVAITGVAGCLGGRLMRLVDDEPTVARVVGIDRAEPETGSAKLEFHQMDVRDARLAKLLPDVDALVHCAFTTEASRDEAEMRATNLDGLRSVLEAVADAAVPTLVFASSASVYGAHPDNAVPLTESSPLRANAEYAPAWQLLEAERSIESFAGSHPRTTVTVLRPATVFGPTAQNFVTRMLEAPRLTSVKGFDPPLQVVHEDDVAAALLRAALGGLPGAYNVAPDGWLSSEDLVAASGKKRVELAESVAFSLAERLWRARVSEAPPGELRYLMHPWVVDNAKLKAAGWAPRFTNAECLAITLEANRSWVALGRARMRKDDLAKGAAATIGVVGAMALVRRAKRKRDDRGD